MPSYRQGNYQFVVDSGFQPFSMQEMLVPFTMYKDAYEKSEAAYDELNQKAGDFKYLASTLPEGSKARSIYEGYADDLKAQAADLSHNGLSMNNRRALSSLRQRYEGEIGRLKKIDAIRRAQIEEQRKLYLQDPTRMFSREAAMTPFDDYLENPDLTYNSYSGALLAQQVGQAASAIAKSLTNYGKGQPLDGFTKTWLEQHGFTPAQVAQAIQNPDSPGADAVLKTLVQNTIDNSGIAGWADPATLNQAYAYARQGLWNAVGQTNIHTYTDEAAKLAAQEEAQKRVADYSAGMQARANRPQIIPRALRSQQEIEDNTKLINTFIRNGYVKEVNGKYELTPLGKKVYSDPVKVTESDLPKWMSPEDRMVAIKGLQAGKEQSDFRIFMDKLNGGKPLYDGKNSINGGKGNFMPTHAGNLFTQAVKNNSSEVYDMYHSTEYVRQLPTGAYQDAFKQQIMAEPENLVKLDFNGKNGWKEEKTEKSELKDFKPVRFNYSRYGNTITWVNDKGESVRTNAPKGVNEQVSNEVMKAFDFENVYSQVLQAGKLPKTVWDYSENRQKIAIDKEGRVQFTDTPLTREQMQIYTNDWYNAMDAIQSIGAMYIAPSTTKTREFGSYDFGSGIGNISELISDSNEE